MRSSDTCALDISVLSPSAEQGTGDAEFLLPNACAQHFKYITRLVSLLGDRERGPIVFGRCAICRRSEYCVCAALSFVHHENVYGRPVGAVNFWSHFVPSLLFLLCTPIVFFYGMHHENIMERIFMVIYMLAATNCMISSSCFHLFGCRSHRASISLGKIRLLSPTTYHRLLTKRSIVLYCSGHTDFKGIILLITASYVPALSFFFRPQPFWRLFYLSLTFIVFVKALILVKFFADWGWRTAKNLVFVFGAAWGLIPTAQFVVFGNHSSEVIGLVLGRLARMYGLYLLGFVLYSTRFPERFYPGKTDLLGQSHHLWHICVTLASISWLESLLTFYSSLLIV